jgi:general secretion pathway protein G
MNLTEMLTCMAVIGITYAAVMPNVAQVMNKAKVHKARVEVQSIQNAANMYQMDNNQRPNNLAQLTQGTEPYLKVLPKDPWNKAYVWQNGIVSSYGSDGQAGGAGTAADIIAPNAW